MLINKIFMKKSIFTCLLLVLLNSLFGQKFWKEVRELPTASREPKAIHYMPSSYKSISLDFNALKEELANVNDEFSQEREISYINLPLPTGENINFRVSTTKTMEEALAAKYPGIKTYKGWSDDGLYTVRFDMSPFGMRAAMRTPIGEVYIDPYLKENQEYHIVYYTKNHTEPMELMGLCGASSEEPKRFGELRKQSGNRSAKIDLHEYRFALGCTGEWGAIRGTKEKALADMVTSVNRLNLIFENEFASRFVLIADNDKLIHLDASIDPYTDANNGGKLLGQNTQVLNNILGSPNVYDIGHVYTNSCTDVGGIAFFSICANNRGGGVTCQYTNLLYITVQVAAHEIGHQMSASHTHNFCTADTQNGGERGYEPGSGNTIMAYGSLCGSNNIGGPNVDYYHQGSLNQIYTELREPFGIAYGCAKKISINNDAPVAKILTQKSGLIIPKSTPFVLDGIGIDANNNKLTYTWEQKDGSATGCSLGSPSGDCPLFRSFRPDTIPYRILPSPSLILSDQTSKTEILPAYGRDINFSFTVRDNSPLGGYANWELMKLRSSESAGPFWVTFPAEGGVKVPAGSKFVATWLVADTDKGEVNAKYVDIYVSRNSAIHLSNPELKLLASNVPNTGSAEIQMDSILSSDTRLFIKPADNIWFNISRVRFEVVAPTKPTAFITPSVTYSKICGTAITEVEIKSSPIGNYAGAIKYSLGQLPSSITASFSANNQKVGTPIKLSITPKSEIKSGSYTIPYFAIMESGDTITKNVFIDVTSTNFNDLNSLLPLNGNKDAELPLFTWSKAVNATSYTLQVSKSPTFSTIDLTTTTQDTFFKPIKTFDKKSVYYWRLNAINACGAGGYTDPKGFGTLTQDCNKYSVTAGLPINISAGGPSTVTAKINVPTGKNISDVNISKLKIRHDNYKDLTGTLISPANTRVILWDNICEKILNIEVLVDDQAPAPFGCNNTATGQYKPVEPLSKINGEDGTGVWTLEIKDNKAGNGGRLDSFSIEICASIDVKSPQIATNKPLEIKPNQTLGIGSSFLKVTDANSSAAQLTYNVVSLPVLGQLLLNGTALKIGDTYTQADIDANKLSYKSTTNLFPREDRFDFLVQDNEGGWLGVERFNIKINDVTGVNDPLISSMINIYPNPVSNIMTIELKDQAKNYSNFRLYDNVGKLILTRNLSSTINQIDVSNFAKGQYFIQLKDADGNAQTKTIIITD
jgi:subtilisin-like proprotein convertase family protein